MESGDLEPRVAALENQVRDLTGRVQGTEQDAAAARVLAGAADRDVSELRGEIRDFRRATTASFNAMRQDFVDLRHDVSPNADSRHVPAQRIAKVMQGSRRDAQESSMLPPPSTARSSEPGSHLRNDSFA